MHVYSELIRVFVLEVAPLDINTTSWCMVSIYKVLPQLKETYWFLLQPRAASSNPSISLRRTEDLFCFQCRVGLLDHHGWVTNPQSCCQKDTSDASHLSFLPKEEARMVKGLAQGHRDVWSQPPWQAHPALELLTTHQMDQNWTPVELVLGNVRMN